MHSPNFLQKRFPLLFPWCIILLHRLYGVDAPDVTGSCYSNEMKTLLSVETGTGKYVIYLPQQVWQTGSKKPSLQLLPGNRKLWQTKCCYLLDRCGGGVLRRLSVWWRCAGCDVVCRFMLSLSRINAVAPA